jgi:hypothetical protein
VLAALIGLIGGAGTISLNAGSERARQAAGLAAEREKAKCDRAFGFLQDEALNPRLEQDDEFYRSQRRIAIRCSYERQRP